jgi:hypothetical protein
MVIIDSLNRAGSIEEEKEDDEGNAEEEAFSS